MFPRDFEPEMFDALGHLPLLWHLIGDLWKEDAVAFVFFAVGVCLGLLLFRPPPAIGLQKPLSCSLPRSLSAGCLALALAVTSASFLSARGWLVVLLKVRLFVFDLGLLHVEAGRPQIEFKHPHYTIKEKQDCSVRRTMCAP